MTKPEDVQTQLRLAVQLIKQGDNTQAQTIIRDLVKRAPENPDVWYLASISARDRDRQIQLLEHALKIQPNHFHATARLTKLRTPETLSPAPPSKSSGIQTSKIVSLPSKTSTPKPAALSITKRIQKQEKPQPRLRGSLFLFVAVGVVAVALVGLLLVRTGVISLTTASGGLLNQSVTLLTGQQNQISGERIAFFEGDSMFFINPDGTNQTLMYRSNDLYFDNNRGQGFTWSPDGSHFAFTNRDRFNDFKLVHDPSGQTSTLLGLGSAPSWSPDGRQVVISQSDSREIMPHLVLANVDGSNSHPITSDDGIAEYDPEWSPNGSLIVFVRREGEQEVLYTINPDGSGETRLTNGNLPQWSPDGQALSFNRAGAIYRINPDGSDEAEIFPATVNNNYPIPHKWSPDSQKIALLNLSLLTVMTADGSEILWAASSSTENFVWSPDSQRILILDRNRDFTLIDLSTGSLQTFIASRANESLATSRSFSRAFVWLSENQIQGVNRAIQAGDAIKQLYLPVQPYYFGESANPVSVYRFNGNNSPIEHLESSVSGTETQNTVTGARWSPDGKQIAISFYDYEARGEALYLINVDGSNLHPLTPLGFDPVWSPDSQWISFLLGSHDNASLYVIDAAGGEPIQMAQNMNDETWDWSPDSEQLVYSLNHEITVVNADGTNARVLVNGSAPDWSPDGQHIVFRGRTETEEVCICVIPADGSAAPITLTLNGDNPIWSPDGQYIVFEHDGLEIYTVSADGSDVRRLTHSDVWKRNPTWSPDGLYIAYWEDRASSYQLNVMHADGTGQYHLPIHPIMGFRDRPEWLPSAVHANLSGFSAIPEEFPSTPIPTVAPLTANPVVQPTFIPTLMTPRGFQPPTPTPFGGAEQGGGTGLLFFGDGSINYQRYFTVNLHDRTPTHVPMPDGITQVTMHPDGQHYVGTQGGGAPMIVLIDKDDLSVSPIPNIGRAFDFAISPDGSRIAYLQDDLNTYLRQIWVANIDGSNAHQLTQHPLGTDNAGSYFIGSPDWSPDGRQIAYGYYSNRTNSSQVRIIDVQTLSNDLLVEPGGGAAWSPDGEQIAYVVNAGGSISHIAVVNVDGSNSHVITTGQSSDSSPVWSPNGQHIAFLSTASLYVVNADGSDPTLVLPSQPGMVPYTNLSWQIEPDPLLVTFTPAPTITPSATPTATATATPLPATATVNPAARFEFTPTTGRASVVLHASPPDSFLVNGYADLEGNVTIEGITQLETIIGDVSFILLLGEDFTSDFWTFRFYAPDIEVARTYEVETRFGTSDELSLPAMSITSPGRGCSYILGDFVIEQAEPEIIISFTHYCDQDPNQKLTGHLIFTP